MIKTATATFRVLTFRKWTRKGYSLFRMLKNAVRIGVLAVVYHSASAGQTSGIMLPAPDTTGVSISLELEEIEVGAGRAPVIFPEAARIVTVITSEALGKLPVSSIPEVLRYHHGIDIRQRGADGIQADLSLRGGSFDQTAILLNGINITDPQTGHHNLNIPLNFSQIDRIEILEGPAARVYGPNAFSGAINIITKTSEKTALTASYSIGSFGYQSYEATGSAGKAKFAQTLSLNHKSSDGYINNTDYKVFTAFYQNSGKFKEGQLDYQLGYSEKSFGANAFYTPRYPDQFEQTRTLLTSVRWKSNSPVNFTPAVFWRRNHDRFELFRGEKPGWYTTHNYHMTDVFGINVNSWFMTKAGKTAGGSEIRSESIWSNVLGEKLLSEIKVPGEDAYFSRFKSRNSFSFFLEHTWWMRRLHITAGFLLQRTSDLDLKWQFFPGLDAGYKINPDVRLFFSSGKSLRLPTFTDLYYNGPTNVGNSALKPEEIIHAEGGIKYLKSGISGHANIYYQSATNLIDWVKLPGEEVWKTTNHTQVNSIGYQLFAKINFQEYLPGFLNGTLSAGYNRSELSKKKTEFLSYYALDNLKDKATFNFNHTFFKYFSSGWNLVYQDRNGTYSSYGNGTFIEKNYDPFWLLDWMVKYSHRHFECMASITNLFNTHYFDFGNITQPGRWIKATLTLKID
jgi:vitamin B12 transporter